MRALLVPTLASIGILLASSASVADAADRAGSGARPSETRRITKRSYKRERQGLNAYSREAVECERARHADPTGRFRGFPCWAQEALSPQNGNDRQ
jgi:hypothetical protein